MSFNWNLLVPTLIVIGATAAQLRTVAVERRTGQVTWWAKLPVFPRPNYDDPTWFRRRQQLNVIGSIVWVCLALFLTLKFFGF